MRSKLPHLINCTARTSHLFARNGGVPSRRDLFASLRRNATLNGNLLDARGGQGPSPESERRRRPGRICASEGTSASPAASSAKPSSPAGSGDNGGVALAAAPMRSLARTSQREVHGPARCSRRPAAIYPIPIGGLPLGGGSMRRRQLQLLRRGGERQTVLATGGAATTAASPWAAASRAEDPRGHDLQRTAAATDRRPGGRGPADPEQTGGIARAAAAVPSRKTTTRRASPAAPSPTTPPTLRGPGRQRRLVGRRLWGSRAPLRPSRTRRSPPTSSRHQAAPSPQGGASWRRGRSPGLWRSPV